MDTVTFALDAPNLLPCDGQAYLLPGFLSAAEAAACFTALRTELDWAQEEGLFGAPVPRLTAWQGDVAYTYSGITHPPAPWTPTAQHLRDLVGEVVPMPNGVLGNLYRDGNDSVSWHADDEELFGPEPVIASLSLGAPRRFLLRWNQDVTVKVALVLEPGSLLVMAGTCQERWKHCVPKTTRPVGERINLTFRRIVIGRSARDATRAPRPPGDEATGPRGRRPRPDAPLPQGPPCRER